MKLFILPFSFIITTQITKYIILQNLFNSVILISISGVIKLKNDLRTIYLFTGT